MGIVGGKKILKLLEDGKIKISPFNRHWLKGNILDLHMGVSYRSYMDLKGLDITNFSLDDITTYHEIKEGGYLSLKIGETVIVDTLEEIELPSNIMGLIIGRLSLAAIGITVHNGILHPGTSGRRKVMMYNSGVDKFNFRPGDIICHCVFLEVEEPAKVDKIIQEELDKKMLYIREK